MLLWIVWFREWWLNYKRWLGECIYLELENIKRGSLTNVTQHNNNHSEHEIMIVILNYSLASGAESGETKYLPCWQEMCKQRLTDLKCWIIDIKWMLVGWWSLVFARLDYTQVRGQFVNSKKRLIRTRNKIQSVLTFLHDTTWYNSMFHASSFLFTIKHS